MADNLLSRDSNSDRKMSEIEDTVELYQQAANSYKLAKSWEQAAATYYKLVDCHLRMANKHDAATSYVDAASCYKKISPKQAVSSLEHAIELFSDLGRFNLAALYCKEVGGLYEQTQNLEQAIVYFERAYNFFQSEDVPTSAIQCRQKVALLSAQLHKYTKASEIFEDIAWQCLHNNSLRYAVRGHLLNAGICHLCEGETVAITNALECYQDMDSTFSRTREYQLLADLAVAVDEEHVEDLTEILKEYDSLSPLVYPKLCRRNGMCVGVCLIKCYFVIQDAWKTNMLLRVKEVLKAKEVEEADPS